MKAREVFLSIREQRQTRFSLRLRLTVLVSAELVGSVLIALGAWSWLEVHVLQGKNLPMDSNILLLVVLLVISLLIGFCVTWLLSKQFFNPIKKLQEAMGTVAKGDFSVRLNTNKSSKEIREINFGFNLMARELQSTEILQTDFVSNVSHEFKTPINAIEGYSTLLQDCENLSGDQQQYVEKILFNTKRLSSLVGNILLLSKIENQSIPTNLSTFRLDEQVRQTIVGLEQEWTKKNIEFDVEMDNVSYVGNENLLQHVWSNLIGNAIKFSPEFGLVSIHLTQTKNKICFTVNDQGPGLSEEAQSHAFDKFYQADGSHKQEGNGLGLALVKRIVTLFGGEVCAQNREDGGCCFTVTLRVKSIDCDKKSH